MFNDFPNRIAFDRYRSALRSAQKRKRSPVRVTKPFCSRREPVFGVSLKNNAMNRLKGYSRIMNVHKLHECIPSRMTCPFFLRKTALLLQPAVSRCSQTMISVSNREPKVSAAGGLFGQEPCGIAANASSSNMPSAAHQIKIVDRILGGRRSKLHQLMLRIIKEQHDMRHLNARIHTNPDTGRKSILHRVLRSPNWCIRLIRVVKRLEINHADESAAYLSAGKRPLHIN